MCKRPRSASSPGLPETVLSHPKTRVMALKALPIYHALVERYSRGPRNQKKSFENKGPPSGRRLGKKCERGKRKFLLKKGTSSYERALGGREKNHPSH